MNRVAIAVLLLVASALPVGAEEAPKPIRSAGEVTEAALRDVRSRAIAHLRRTQHADGSWKIDPTPSGLASLEDVASDVPGGIGGVTAMVVYALASAGVSAKDPALVRAAAWLRETPGAFRPDGWSGGTVAIAMRVLALVSLDAVLFREQIRKDAATIEAGALAGGSWAYDLLDPKARLKKAKRLRKSGSEPERGCVLVSDLAVQALWAAREHAGYHVSKRTWIRLRRRLAKTQRKDGTWTDDVPKGIRRDRTTTPATQASYVLARDRTMTAAALASYVLARARTHEALTEARTDEVARRGRGGWRRQSSHQGELSFVEFAFFSEHAATAAGWKDEDWYVKIAGELVSRQRKDGSWARGFETRDRRDVRATAAALLCISGASKQLFKAEDD